MRTFTRSMFLVLALMLVGLLTASAQDDMWDDGWQGDGCATDATITTLMAQQTLGRPVVRLSTYPCAFAWSSPTATSFNVPSGWVAVDLSGEIGIAHLGEEGKKVELAQAIFFSLAGDTNMTPERIAAIAARSTNEGCPLAPELNAESVSEMISTDATNPVVLTKTNELCGYVTRGSNMPAVIPVGIMATIHPFGDDGSHNDGEDDLVYMWQGDESGQVHQIFAATIRPQVGYTSNDAVNADVCKLWAKEIANGAMDVNPFLVLKGNLNCPYNPELVRVVIRELAGPNMERNLAAFEVLHPHYLARYPQDVAGSTATPVSAAGALVAPAASATAQPTAQPTVVPSVATGICRITPNKSDGANVRSEPVIPGNGTQNNIVDAIEFGASPAVIGNAVVDNYHWWQIDGGWVRSDVVTAGGDCRFVPIIDVASVMQPVSLVEVTATPWPNNTDTSGSSNQSTASKPVATAVVEETPEVEVTAVPNSCPTFGGRQTNRRDEGSCGFEYDGNTYSSPAPFGWSVSCDLGGPNEEGVYTCGSVTLWPA